MAPLGLVFGIIALVRTSHRGERGKGLAVAGVAVSGAVLVLAFLTLVGALRFSAWSSGSPAGPVRGTAGGASSPWRRGTVSPRPPNRHRTTRGRSGTARRSGCPVKSRTAARSTAASS
ncbi:DUF4190 domain-containing protein [Streptomyces sp. DpondAA-F4]|uniref:DUF4190 domain-containing protein n=1 Tax=unclassified Streptomyces TaxID=2593676 RepID=UPI00351EC8ED